jgi:hypothetical protein
MERCGAARFRPNRPCRPLACDVRARTYRDVCPKACSPMGAERSSVARYADRVAAMSSRADSLGAREQLAGDGRERVAKARTGGDTQLWKSSVEVTADGPVRQEEPFRNLLVRQA